MRRAPELRFRQFTDDWEQKKLSEIGRFFKGAGISKTDLSEEGTPCVLYGQLYTMYNEVIDDVISKTNITVDKLVMGQENDVLIPSSGETAIDIATASCLKKSNVALGGDLNVIRPYKENGVFISYQLNNSKKKEISRLAQGASVVHIYNEQLKKLKIDVPSEIEQIKIAEFFSVIDKKIQAQQKKVQTLEVYKKGVLQKIFSQEIRFKDNKGNSYPDWEQKKLASIIRDKSKGNTPVYAEKGNILLSNEYLEENNVPIYVQADIDVSNEDILILWDGSQAGKVYTGVSGVLGSTFMKINLNTNNCNKFIYQQLKWKLEYIQRAWREGSGVPHVAKDFLQNYKVMVPCYEEQIAISKLLSALDYKISKEQDKINQLREFKQGLLKKMLI